MMRTLRVGSQVKPTLTLSCLLCLSTVGTAQIQTTDGTGEPQLGVTQFINNQAYAGATLESRLAVLEQAWVEMQAADAQAVSTAATKPTFKLGGRVHLDQWYFTDTSPGIGFFEHPVTGNDPENRIFFRRIRLEASGDILDNMDYRFQVDFNNPQTPEYKDMYIGFKDLPLLNTVRFGNQKRPLGLDHLNSSRRNIFMERPLPVETFNPDARRIGAASYNSSEDESLNLTYGVFSQENTRSDGRLIGDSAQWSLNARLFGSPLYECQGQDYLHLALSTMVAKPDGDVGLNDTNNNEARFATRTELKSDRSWLDTGRIAGADWYQVLAMEALYNAGPLQITGEYFMNWTQRDSDTLGTGPDLYFQGAYIYAAYMLTGEHMPYNRRSGTIGRVKPFRNFRMFSPHSDGPDGWGAWQIALRYSHLNLSDADVRGGVGDDLTCGVVWYFNPYASLQFNAVYGEIEDHAPAGGFTDGDFTALGTRLRIDF
ncbi:MAG: porin [Planctomycetaceae bacterium]